LKELLGAESERSEEERSIREEEEGEIVRIMGNEE